MQSPSKIKSHTKLFLRMADTQGVDVDEQVMRGNLDPEVVPQAVLRCTACTRPQECAHWLASHPPTDARVPNYCMNKNLLASLKPTDV